MNLKNQSDFEVVVVLRRESFRREAVSLEQLRVKRVTNETIVMTVVDRLSNTLFVSEIQTTGSFVTSLFEYRFGDRIDRGECEFGVLKGGEKGAQCGMFNKEKKRYLMITLNRVFQEVLRKEWTGFRLETQRIEEVVFRNETVIMLVSGIADGLKRV